MVFRFYTLNQHQMLPNLEVFADKIYERPLTTTAIKNGGEARKRSTAEGGGGNTDETVKEIRCRANILCMFKQFESTPSRSASKTEWVYWLRISSPNWCWLQHEITPLLSVLLTEVISNSSFCSWVIVIPESDFLVSTNSMLLNHPKEVLPWPRSITFKDS